MRRSRINERHMIWNDQIGNCVVNFIGFCIQNQRLIRNKQEKISRRQLKRHWIKNKWISPFQNIKFSWPFSFRFRRIVFISWILNWPSKIIQIKIVFSSRNNDCTIALTNTKTYFPSWSVTTVGYHLSVVI